MGLAGPSESPHNTIEGVTLKALLLGGGVELLNILLTGQDCTKQKLP